MVSLLQTLAVAEYLNLRHAANALGVSQSSLSTRIRVLEEDLGVALFERHARGVRLTDAGRRFVEKVAAGVDQLDDAVKTAGMTARSELGRLRVGVHALVSGGFLAELIGLYRDQYPSIDLDIIEGTARETMAQLRADRLDVSFVANAPDFPDCLSRRIWTERLKVVLPPNHLLAHQTSVMWADLASETFLVPYGGTGPQVHDHILLRLAGGWPNASILPLAVERATLLSMVAQGFGVTIVGDATALAPPPGVVFLPITDEPEPVCFSAVWSPQNRSPALRAFLDLAQRVARSAPTA
ncbi:LysR family transcriptional regulator [Marinicauda algicola]|nr:LysR family transcriptional regulator [Marinicauda algicola]